MRKHSKIASSSITTDWPKVPQNIADGWLSEEYAYNVISMLCMLFGGDETNILEGRLVRPSVCSLFCCRKLYFDTIMTILPKPEFSSDYVKKMHAYYSMT